MPCHSYLHISLEKIYHHPPPSPWCPTFQILKNWVEAAQLSTYCELVYNKPNMLRAKFCFPTSMPLPPLCIWISRSERHSHVWGHKQDSMLLRYCDKKGENWYAIPQCPIVSYVSWFLPTYIVFSYMEIFFKEIDNIFMQIYWGV